MSDCLSSLWPGFNFQLWQSIPRDFSLADHTLPNRFEPAWHKMAPSPLNGTTQPVVIEEEGRSPTTDRQWLRYILTKGTLYDQALNTESFDNVPSTLAIQVSCYPNLAIVHYGENPCCWAAKITLCYDMAVQVVLSNSIIVLTQCHWPCDLYMAGLHIHATWRCTPL